jgi:hypothetical protein
MEVTSEGLKRKILGLLHNQNVMVAVKPELRYVLRKALLFPLLQPARRDTLRATVNPQAEDSKLIPGTIPSDSRSVLERHRTLDVGELREGRVQEMGYGTAEEWESRKRAKWLRKAPPVLQGDILDRIRGESRREVQQVVRENASNYQYEYPETSDYVHYSHDVDSLKLRHMNLNGLKGATLDKLIEKVTTQGNFELRSIILITYENFTTSYNLLLALLRRFLIPWPLNMSLTEATTMLDSRFKVIQNKILAFLQFWLQERKEDFNDPRVKALLDASLAFIESDKLYNHLNKRQIKVQIMPLLNKLADATLQGKREKSAANFDPKEIVLPSTPVAHDSLVAGSGLLEYSPDIVAMQLALIDQKYFCGLTAADFMIQKRSSEGPSENGARQRLNDRHNLFTNFIAAYILKELNPTTREVLIERFLDIARRSLEYGNINATFIIHTALTAYIATLKKTWPKLMMKHRKLMEDLKTLFCSDDNYGKLRECTRNTQLPCVPCFSLWGKDMETIFQLYKEDFLPNPTGDSQETKRMIFMVRQAVIADRMKDLTYYQKVKYRFYKLPALYNFLESEYKDSLSLVIDLAKVNNAHVTFFGIIQALEP